MLWGVVVSAMFRLVGCRMLIASHNKLLERAASTDAALVKRSRQEATVHGSNHTHGTP